MFYATELTYPYPLLAINYTVQFGERFKEERKAEKEVEGDSGKEVRLGFGPKL